MKDTLNEWIAEVPERERVFAQEQLIVSVAENIWEKMETQGVTKADIAKTLGKSKAFITQCLNGGRNMTLRTLSDIAFVCMQRSLLSCGQRTPRWLMGRRFRL